MTALSPNPTHEDHILTANLMVSRALSRAMWTMGTAVVCSAALACASIMGSVTAYIALEATLVVLMVHAIYCLLACASVQRRLVRLVEVSRKESDCMAELQETNHTLLQSNKKLIDCCKTLDQALKAQSEQILQQIEKFKD